MPQRTTVFVSYSHKNKRWLQRLRVHLKPLDRQGVLDLWDDGRIDPGAGWKAQIEAAMDRAAASVLLVSADFLASDFVVVHELPKLLLKAQRLGVRILPIFVEPCEIRLHPEIAALQALNSPDKPLAKLPRVEAEAVLVRAVDVVGGILSQAATLPPVAESVVHVASTVATTQVFEQLQRATIALSLLSTLVSERDARSLTELEGAIQLRSRKRAYEELKALVTEGWVEKNRIGGLTRYRSSPEGIRQWHRLAAVCDGPVRRAEQSMKPGG